jgi:chemotaxis protein CheZ
MGSVSTSDTEDLEALFDQIAAGRAAAEAEPAAAAQPAAALAEDRPAAAVAHAQEGAEQDPYDIFHRVGQLTRNLHDALRELGYDKGIDAAVGKLPDARSRLHYIANLTGQAAEKALSKAEAGAGLQEQIEADARALATKWEDVFAGRMGVEEFKTHAEHTRAFLNGLPDRTSQASALFTDIMLAQDFHDLTGQVINKIVGIAENLEHQLVKLLLDTTPPQARAQVESEWLNGPVIDKTREDVVNNQGQVDDLLASLGF